MCINTWHEEQREEIWGVHAVAGLGTYWDHMDVVG